MTVEDIDETRPLLANANADAGDKSARALAAVVRRLSMISESFLIASSGHPHVGGSISRGHGWDNRRFVYIQLSYPSIYPSNVDM